MTASEPDLAFSAELAPQTTGRSRLRRARQALRNFVKRSPLSALWGCIAAAVVVIASRGVDREKLQNLLRPEQKVIDLVNLEKKRRVKVNATYAGICW